MSVDLGAVDDFVDGEIKIVEVDGVEYGVLRRDESFLLVRNVCPHAGAPIATGMVARGLAGTSTSLEFNPQGDVLVCPWHRWEFQLSDSKCTQDPLTRIRTYEVTVVVGRVVTELQARRPQRAPRRARATT